MTDIQKGNFIKPIFLLAFVKWLSSRHPWIYCDNITFNQVHLQVEMTDEKLKELTDDLKTGHFYTTSLRTDIYPIEKAVDKFFKLNIIYVVLMSYENDNNSDISFVLDYKSKYREFENLYCLRQLYDYLMSQLKGERLLSEYDPTYEYYFNESLFNELFSFIYQVYLVQFRNVVLQYT
jgi:hypothetical protein